MAENTQLSQEESEIIVELSKTLKGSGTQDVQIVNGKKFLPMFETECINYAVNEWDIPENSVIISSFAKTGTIWCMEIVRQILYGRDDALQRFTKAVPSVAYFIEVGTPKKFEVYSRLPIPRQFFYTHIPAELFDFEKLKARGTKIIYMYRNPKDQVVSWYNFITNTAGLSEETQAKLLGKDWNEFFYKYTAGQQPTWGSEGEWYPDHVLAWMNEAKVNKDIMPIEFEAMKKDCPSEVRKIANFLGVELTDEDVKDVTKRCSFSSMKNAAAAKKGPHGEKFFRKGGVGGWKEVLTASESEHIDREVEKKLAGSGITFTYEL